MTSWKLLTQSQVILRERIMYTLVTLIMFAFTGLISVNYLWFAYAASGFMGVLLVVRAVDFFQQGKEYFLIDYCYASASLMIYNVIYPSSQFRLLFGYCLSIVIIGGVPFWGNSLIPQSSTHFISFYLHLIQAPVYFTMDLSGWIDKSSISHWDLFVNGFSVMLAYQVFYLFHSFFWTYSTWTTTPKMNLYKHLKRGKVVQQLVAPLGDRLGGITVIMLMWVHWLCTLLYSPFIIQSHYAMGAICAGGLAVGVWNASRFYFAYVPTKYQDYLATYGPRRN